MRLPLLQKLGNRWPGVPLSGWLYLVLCYALAAYFFGHHPIQALDTDLWYHLNGGRYIAEHHSLPEHTFFSFLDPPRERVDYFWLFRLCIYKIYMSAGYEGLIVFRSLTYLLLMSAILVYLCRGVKTRHIWWASMAFFSLYLGLMIPRYLILRPHLISYALIPVCICLLELRSYKVFLLPVLAVVWNNCHGITYPDQFLLYFAYLAKFAVARHKSQERMSRGDKFFLLAVALAMLAVVATPHGLKLLSLPFISTASSSQYLLELKTFDWLSLFKFTFWPFSYATLFNITFWLCISLMVLAIIYRKVELHELILLGGGLFLLTKGIRFYYEFSLFMLPVFKKYLLVYWNDDKSRSPAVCPRYLTIALASLLTLLPIGGFVQYNRMNQNWKYPLAHDNLPQGVVAFLNHVNTGGNVLNPPNSGGYLQWQLNPGYKIAIDMQVPHLFTDTDMYWICNTLKNGNALENLAVLYTVDFICVPLTNTRYADLLKEYGYTWVFFDDYHFLFANDRTRKEIVRQYAITELLPSQLEKLKIASLAQEQMDRLLSRLLRIQQIYRESYLVNQSLALIYAQKRDWIKAVEHAELTIQEYPGLPKGYHLKGDFLVLQNRPQEAIPYYRQALKLSDAAGAREIYKKLAWSYLDLQQYSQAHRAFSSGLKIYEGATYLELHAFSLAAEKLGKYQEALLMLQFAYLTTPYDDIESRQQISKDLERLEALYLGNAK